MPESAEHIEITMPEYASENFGPTEKPPSPEKLALAKKTLFETLEIEACEPAEFVGRFKAAIRSLPKYQETWDALKDIPEAELASEVFAQLKRSADPKIPDGKDGPTDGVLIRSIRQTGELECAGRTFIAADILERKGVRTSVIQAPGHSFLVYEADGDRLGYFDANNDIRFTFPRSALKGYRGPGRFAECELEGFVAGPKDEVDGFGRSVFTRMVTMPPDEGVLRQYFGNVASALNGSDEFATSGLPTDEEASKAMFEFEREVIGEPDPIIENFNNRMPELKLEMKKKNESDIKMLLSISAAHKEKDGWIDAVTEAITGALGESFPYVQKASIEARKRLAEQAWKSMQDPRMISKIKEIR